MRLKAGRTFITSKVAKVESKTFKPTFALGMGTPSNVLLAICNTSLGTDAVFFALFDRPGDSNLVPLQNEPLEFKIVMGRGRDTKNVGELDEM